MKILKNYFFYLVLFLVGLAGVARGQYTVLHNFGTINPDGGFAYCTLTPSGNKLYGITPEGGAFGNGIIFSVDTNGNQYKDLFDFNGTKDDLGYAYGSLTIFGKKLFGMTCEGAAYNLGCVFSIDTDGSNYKDLMDFSGANGRSPISSSLMLFGKVLYGMTELGGGGAGNIFAIDTDGSGYRDLLNFYYGNNGYYPTGNLTFSGNKFYGMTSEGGPLGEGNIFSVDTSGSGYKDLLDFNGTNGFRPNGNSLIISGKTLYGMVFGGGVHNDGIIFSIDTNGNNFKGMEDFNDTNGYEPLGSLTLSGGTLYGTTTYGGETNFAGNIFSLDTNGTGFSNLYYFNDSGGAYPPGALIISGYTLYGTTYYGGAYDSGVVFKYYTNCTLTSSATTDASVSCNGGTNGSATAHASGGTSPYTYLWSPSGGTGSIASNLSEGNYIVSVTDANGCNEVSGVTITQPTAINAVVSTSPYDTCAEQPMCLPYGTASVTSISGGTPPYTFTWPDLSTGSTWQATSYGNLTLTITDSLGCTTTVPFNVATTGAIGYFYDAPVVIPDTNGMGVGSICLHADGGNYSWCCSLPNSDCVYNLTTGTYCCVVTPYVACTCAGPDSTICINVGNIISTGTNEVKGEGGKVIVYPNPNNGFFTIEFVGASARMNRSDGQNFVPATIEIYNVLGQKVLTETLRSANGSNLINLSEKPDGIYFYRALTPDGVLIGEGKVIVAK